MNGANGRNDPTHLAKHMPAAGFRTNRRQTQRTPIHLTGLSAKRARNDRRPYVVCMALLTATERATCRAYRELIYGNPFLPTRMEAERRALGGRFSTGEAVWSRTVDFERGRANLGALQDKAEALVAAVRSRLAEGKAASDEDRQHYTDLAAYVLYYRDQPAMLAHARDESATPIRPVWRRFADAYRHLFGVGGESLSPHSAEHLFALCFQTRRAFLHVYNGLLGGSAAAAALRGEVWHSIFTHDRRRYAALLFDRMDDLATLVTGESGTGKEVVAGALARSQYRRFDARGEAFEPAGLFAPLNLSALPQALIESELFGHKRGSFTGASSDRRGWLELVERGGCVFLDEVGDVEPGVQVKLLRVLQERSFQRVGEAKPRRFAGKIIAATNRDLPAEMDAGRFRRDLFYRLSGDLLRTPTLREQVAGDAAELAQLAAFVARRVIGKEDDAACESLTSETLEVIARDLGGDYPWPGNFRELEQCVRNVLVRRRYTAPAKTRGDDFPAAVAAGTLTAEELLTRYVARVWRSAGSYEAAARRLKMDRRTVRSRVAAAGRSTKT